MTHLPLLRGCTIVLCSHVIDAVILLVAFSAITGLTPLSEAKIVYTPGTTTLADGHIVIDLNHDGIKDFDIQAAISAVACGYTGHGVHGVVTIMPTTGDDVVASGGNVAALSSGIRVGPTQAFSKYQSLMTNFQLSRGCSTYSFGNWCHGYAYACSGAGYLGLKFLVNGQVHYGWAYVRISGSLFSGLSVTLNGFAYETIAGQGITTGQTSGT